MSKESISSIARGLGLSRPTIRKYCQDAQTAVPYRKRRHPSVPALGQFGEILSGWLTTEQHLPRQQRRSGQRLFEGLQSEGYRGAYDSVQRFVRRWKGEHGSGIAHAFVPLSFSPGEACQFDWSHEDVELNGVMQRVKVAHFRLAYSRQSFVVAYLRETQEMVFDAHDRAFAFFGGAPARVIYDNLKAVVEAIFTGKDRRFNRRFMALANHYLFEPVACTPASGWEKGQVENQVGNIREWLFTPLARFPDLEALNAWLTVRCREIAGRANPAMPERTIADCFVEEKAALRPIVAPFDGYVERIGRVSSTCLIMMDRNRYSVPGAFAKRVVSVRYTATSVWIVADETIIAEHLRCFGRDQTLFDPWHYLSVLDRKPGAIRNGTPFREWDLPKAIQQVRDRILKQPRGDRAFVDLLLVARDAGLDTLEIACDLALKANVVSGPVLMNALCRLMAPIPPVALNVPDRMKLVLEPVADCSRYDRLREAAHVIH